MKSISQKLQDDIRDIMEGNIKHPNQQKIDVHEPEKDEITADDFKKLRAMKKTKTEEHAPESTEQVEEEEKKKPVSPFDYKNYQSQIPKKPGETAGFDSKKISTGTVYTRKPVKEESHQSATTMKHIPNASPALKKAAKDIKPGVAGYRDRIDMLKAGGVKEETQIDELSKSTLGSYLTKKTSEYMKGKTQPGTKEHAKDVQNMGKAYDKLKEEEAELDEAYQTAKSEFVARQGRLTAAAAETEKDPARLKRMSSIPGYSAAMDLAKKTTQGAKHTKEEVEQMDELSVETMKSAKEKLANKAYDAHMDDNKMAARNFAHRALKVGSKIKSKERSSSQMTREEVEMVYEANIQPTAAKSRSHIGNISHPTTNHVAHPSSGKEIGLITKQPDGKYHAHPSSVKLSHSQGGTFDTKDQAHQHIRDAHAKAIKTGTLSDRWKKQEKLPQFAKEEVEQEEYTFADYLNAALEHYNDEEAVNVANEAYNKQDISLFIKESQQPEA